MMLMSMSSVTTNHNIILSVSILKMFDNDDEITLQLAYIT